MCLNYKGILNYPLGLPINFVGKLVWVFSTPSLHIFLNYGGSLLGANIVPLQNGGQEISEVLDEKTIWRSIWCKHREEKVNKFLWQLAYWIPTMQRYICRQHVVKDKEGVIIPFTRDNPL